MRKREIFTRAAKISIGTIVAILIATYFSLENAASAGIIALLTIQTTRQKTFKLVASRISSFVLTVFIAILIDQVISNEFIKYAILLFFICLFVFFIRWDLTLSVNAVIGTHFFLAKNAITPLFILNEAYILTIGTVIAAIINLLMFDKEKVLKNEILKIERQMKFIIQSMSLHLLQFSQLTMDKRNIDILISRIDEAINLAFENKENTLKSHSDFYIDYFRLRKAQCTEFLHIYREIISLNEKQIEYIGPATDLIVSLLNEIANEISIKKDCEQMLKKIDESVKILDSYPLPGNQLNFKTRFMLYHLLGEMKENELLKLHFKNSLTEEQNKLYVQ